MPVREPIIGLDFGAINSVVAVVQQDDVEVLTNDVDKRTTPSCVYVKDGEREVGEAAIRMATSYPANTVRNVKSILGRTKETLRSAPLGAVQVEEHPSDKNIMVRTEDKTSLSEGLVAMILLELKKTSQLHLKCDVQKCVIAVPSYFGVSQRRAIVDAASAAGLETVELVNDTTAAAMAYAHDREGKKTVVLVDVGGGGSSVAVVKVETNKVWVQSHSGVRLPGGEDFDAKMVEYLKQCVKKKFHTEVDDPRDIEILRSNWTKAKEKLSRIPVVSISVFLPGIDEEFAEEVKRADFEGHCRELFEEITNGLLRSLSNGGVYSYQVDEVLLVGGSSRIPRLRALIQKEFMNKPLSKAINPDEAVAEGAALLAVKCVKVEQEVLSLITEVTIEDKLTTLHRNTKLPCLVAPQPPIWMPLVEVQQEENVGYMVPVIKFKKRGSISLEICKSGLLHIIDSTTGEIPLRMSGCLPLQVLEKLQTKVQAYKQKELKESKRVESKNSLEKVLRVERARETSVDDRFHEAFMELRKDCEKRLQWLSKHSTASCQEFDKFRLEIEERVATLLRKQECERQRVEVRELLRQTLEDIVAADIPDDAFRARASQLKKACQDALIDLGRNEHAAADELEKLLQSTLKIKEDLENDRQLHALELRKRAACDAFESAVVLAGCNWKRLIGGVTDVLHAPHSHKFDVLFNRAQDWLKKHRITADEIAFSREHETFNREVGLLQEELKKDQQRAEERRLQSREALRKKITDALSIKVPEEATPLYMETRKRIEYFKDLLGWLENHPNESQDLYDIYAKKTDDYVAELRRMQAAEEDRVKRKAVIVDTLRNGLEEFKDITLFEKTAAWCNKWLGENPQVDTSSLHRIKARVNKVLDGLRRAKQHQLIQEAEGTSAKEVNATAAADMRALLADFGCTEPDPQLTITTCSTTSEAYVAEHYTRDTPEEHMDVDRVEHFVTENGFPVAPSGLEAVNEEAIMLKVWELFQQPAKEQWVRLEKLKCEAPHHYQVMLECLAEEMAVEALRSAGAAGCMALLLNREVTPVQELVSMSVRFVGITGNAEERMLLVQDKRSFVGTDETFALLLLGRFKKLCERADVNLQKCLQFCSAPDCGHFVPSFLQHLHSEVRGVAVVESISEPLDKRVVNSCYENPTQKDVVVTVLSTVDTLRQKFAVDSKWFPLLKQHCNQQLRSDPWLTYSSSVQFLLNNRKNLSELLDQAAKLDPKDKMIMNAMREKMKEFTFLTCLVAFDGVFSVLANNSDNETATNLDWKTFLSRLEGHEFVLSKAEFWQFLKSRIIATVEIFYITRESEAHALVHGIIQTAINVTRQAMEGFQDCYVLKRCMQYEQGRATSPNDPKNDKLNDEWMSFRAIYSQCDFDMPEKILHQMPRFEFRKQWPTLFAATQRALTVPLLAPTGLPAGAQLREGVRNTSVNLPVCSDAAVTVAARKYRPLDSTLSRAFHSLLQKCPELAAKCSACATTHL